MPCREFRKLVADFSPVAVFALVWACLVLYAGRAGSREVSPDEKLLWSCYMICWPLSRDYHEFYDRPLDRPPRDGTPVRLVDLRRATEAGIDALSIDLFIGDKNALPGFSELVKLVNQHRLPIQLSPMFDGLGDPGLSLDDVAAKIRQWFEQFGHEPCVPRVQGKPVIFTYGASELKPEQWQTLWQRLHADGCDGYWIAELSHFLSIGEKPNFAAARPWLDLFPAANSFNVHSPQRAAEVASGYLSLFPAGRTWVAPVSVGYWRPEIAVYTSQRGTALLRGTWQAIVEAQVRWVQQSTWNDFSENHHLMPSENAGTTLMELNRYLAMQWKGLPAEPDRPQLYLSQQQEVQVGEQAEFEALTILPAGIAPAAVRLQILDGEDRCIHRFAEAAVEKPGLQAIEFRLPLDRIPQRRVLIPQASLLSSALPMIVERPREPRIPAVSAGIRGEGRSLAAPVSISDSQSRTVATVRGPATIVTAAGYRPERNFAWLHTSAQQPLDVPSCTLHFRDQPGTGESVPSTAKPDVSVHVESPHELADVEILHDGRQVLSLRRDLPKASLASPVTWEGSLPVDRRGRLGWGTYTARAVTSDGRIATSSPVFVDRPAEADVTLGHWTFDDDSPSDVLDSSPWLHDGRLGGRPRRKPWFPAHAADPWGGKCLLFDGVDDRVLLEGAIVPGQAYTVECWIKPASRPAGERSGQILFATATAAVVLSIDRASHLQVTRKSDGRWHGIADPAPVVPDQWQHVAATYDGTTLRLYRDGRLCGEQAVPGSAKSGQVAIGYNSVTNQSFYCGCLDELRLTSRALRPDEFGPHAPPGAIRKAETNR